MESNNNYDIMVIILNSSRSPSVFDFDVLFDGKL